jgi:hypothetical protein
MHVSIEDTNFCCGVDEIERFYIEPQRYAYDNRLYTYPINKLKKSGTGLFLASFINTEKNKAAYDELRANHKLLFQSEVYKNKSVSASTLGRTSGVFICVFLHKDCV